MQFQSKSQLLKFDKMSLKLLWGTLSMERMTGVKREEHIDGFKWLIMF